MTGWRKLLGGPDALVAMAVVAVVLMMIVPMPSLILDVLLVFNIGFTLLVLLVAMSIREPLDFSIFPSLLLIVTLFRLALNVSGTRLILLHAHAGSVIDAFGSFVVGGNYVVGTVVFTILVVIQFVVVTNGAQRVAEVAARFTLDAMPGKQMSIDADLNAGMITEAEARRKRKEIQRQSDFFGAMDGASKFVRGDAIAAIVIILVNIVGGMTVGMWQKGMTLLQALQSYTLLTVGEGLVTQIPALLVSTATGLVVTRSDSDGSLGEDVARQVLGWPRALLHCGLVLLLLSLVPGLPKLPFLLLASGAYMASRSVSAPRTGAGTPQAPAPELQDEARDIRTLLEVDPLEVELGQALLTLVDVRRGDSLLERLAKLRRHAAKELGIVVPSVRVRDNLQLRPGEYVIRVFGVELGRGEWMEGMHLAVAPASEALPLGFGQPTMDPTFGLPAFWINPSQAEPAMEQDYSVIDPVSGLGTHFYEILQNHAHELLGRQETRQLLDGIRESRPVLIEELIPGQLGLGEVQKVLQNLLAERVSIRNLVVILETLANRCGEVKDPVSLTEHVRQALGRSICSGLSNRAKELRVLTLSPKVEQALTEALRRSENDLYAGLDPRTLRNLFRNLSEKIEGAAAHGLPVVLCSATVRSAFRRLAERSSPGLTVLSYAEIPSDFRVEVLGVVDVTREPESGPLSPLRATA